MTKYEGVDIYDKYCHDDAVLPSVLLYQEFLLSTYRTGDACGGMVFISREEIEGDGRNAALDGTRMERAYTYRFEEWRG